VSNAGARVASLVAHREAGESIAIVSELHWTNYLPEWFQHS
jgi:hypothetical protein